MKKYAMALIMGLILVFAASCGGNGDDNGNDGDTNDVPLMWHVTSPDGNTMYLFGSIHAASPEIYPLPAFIMDAFGRADYLAVEADLVAFLNDFQAIMAMQALMTYDDGRSLVDDIGQELFDELHAVLDEFNAPPHIMAAMPLFRPWTWVSTLLGLAMERTTMTDEDGIDMYFINLAMERGMEILEVESAMMQLEMMANFSMPLQIHMLRDYLYHIEYAAESLYFLLEAWRIGDYYAMLEGWNEEAGRMPYELRREYTQAMLIDRDLHMAYMARQYMRDGKKVFFMMGALHFVGDDSVVYVLRNAGYTVELVRG